MAKVIPYIQTIGTEKFKQFLSQPFSLDYLKGNTVFDGWYFKGMGTWYKFYDDNNVVLEFYANNYIIKSAKQDTQKLPVPRTVNDFINDMDRLGIQLEWGKFVDDNFEPKDYLSPEEICKYFTQLLIRMGKIEDLD